MMEKYACKSTLDEVLGRCREAYLDYTGQELLFSRDFTKEELSGRRKKLADKIGSEASALIPGAPLQAGHLVSQDATFYYFTGLDVMQSFLLVDGKTGHSTVYLPSRDDMEGEPDDRLGIEEADMVRDRLAFEAVKPVDQLAGDLAGIKTLYFPFAELEGGGITRFQAKGCANQREQNEWDGAEPRHKALIRKIG